MLKPFFFLLLLIFSSNLVTAQTASPEEIAQGQLDAYNNQDIEDFLSWYTEDVEIYNFPGQLVYSGREKMREIYVKLWEQNPNQKATVTERMSLGNTVMDKEKVTGRRSGGEVNVIAIYKIEEGKIRQVHFVRE